MPFKPGENGGAKGGARPGSGRKPDAFKRWIANLVHSPKSRARLKKILEDAQDAETLVTDQGVEVPVRCKADTYLRALELAWHYAEGKPVARVEASGPNGTALNVQIVNYA